jgi:hypothetical protein
MLPRFSSFGKYFTSVGSAQAHVTQATPRFGQLFDILQEQIRQGGISHSHDQSNLNP